MADENRSGPFVGTQIGRYEVLDKVMVSAKK
jgi:hypothetical protein